MDLASRIEHTDLRAAATPADIEQLCREASAHGFHAVCVNPVYVPLARAQGVRVVTVVGFPLGAVSAELKAIEARRAVDDGADEIDMVIPIGITKGGAIDEVRTHAVAVRVAVPGAILKAIIETGCFTPPEITGLSHVVIAAGVDFVKTCTGFGPRGATVEDVHAIRRVSAGKVGIKASGGIRTLAQARALIAAGADRIGTSASVAILREEREGDSSFS